MKRANGDTKDASDEPLDAEAIADILQALMDRAVTFHRIEKVDKDLVRKAFDRAALSEAEWEEMFRRQANENNSLRSEIRRLRRKIDKTQQRLRRLREHS